MSRVHVVGLFLAFALALAGTAVAEPASLETQLHGSWQGELREKGKTLRLLLKVRREGANLLARVYSPDQDDREYIVEYIRMKERRVELELQLISALYAGTMSDDGNEIDGTWTQRGTSLPLVFRRLPAP